MRTNMCALLVQVMVIISGVAGADHDLKDPVKLTFTIGGERLSTTTIGSTFMIHHVENNVSNFDSNGPAHSIASEAEDIYIHIEGTIQFERSRDAYTVNVTGKFERSAISNFTTDSDPANIPQDVNLVAESEETSMEIKAGTRIKLGEEQTLAKNGRNRLTLRIEKID